MAADNPFLALQTKVSEQITTALDAYRDARDRLEEQIFFGFYGSPFVQALLGINDGQHRAADPRKPRPKRWRRGRPRRRRYKAMLETGGFDEALTRAVLYVLAADRMLDQRCALALNVARQQLMHLSLAAFKVMVRDQFFVLQLEPERAIEALAVPCAGGGCAEDLAGAGARDRRRRRSSDRGRERPPGRLSQMLAVPTEKRRCPRHRSTPAPRHPQRRTPCCTEAVRLRRMVRCHHAHRASAFGEAVTIKG